MIPPAIRSAIAEIGFVACPGRCGLVEVVPDEVRERPRICHWYGECRLFLHPDSDEAVKFAEAVYAELCRLARLGIITSNGDEDEDMPVHAWGAA